MTVFNARDSLLPVVAGDEVYVVDDDDPLDDTVVIDSLPDAYSESVEESQDTDPAPVNEPHQFADYPSVNADNETTAPPPLVEDLPLIVDHREEGGSSSVLEDELPDLTSEIELPELELPDFGFALEEVISSDHAGIGTDIQADMDSVSDERVTSQSADERQETKSEALSEATDAVLPAENCGEPVRQVDDGDTVAGQEVTPLLEDVGEAAGEHSPELLRDESTEDEPIERVSLVVPSDELEPEPEKVEKEFDNEPDDSGDGGIAVTAPGSEAEAPPTVDQEIPIPDLLREQMTDNPAQPRRRRQWPWVVGALLLATAIGTQLMLWRWDTLAAKPSVRPLLASVCQLAGCELAPLRDVSAIRLLQRSVYSHPNVEGALIISVSMINEADFAQPFPTLAIRMTDRQGKAVAARNFAPDSYLPAAQHEAQMAPSSPTTITLEVLDPGRDARSYELDFL